MSRKTCRWSGTSWRRMWCVAAAVSLSATTVLSSGMPWRRMWRVAAVSLSATTVLSSGTSWRPTWCVLAAMPLSATTLLTSATWWRPARRVVAAVAPGSVRVVVQRVRSCRCTSVTLPDVTDGLFDVPGDGVPAEHSIDSVVRRDSGAPLAVRMRPASLDEVVGQRHLLGPGSPLRRVGGRLFYTSCAADDGVGGGSCYGRLI